MKKLLCAFLSSALLLGLASCTTKETTVSTPYEEPPVPTSTTTEVPTTAPSVLNEDGLDMTISDVARSVLNAMGDGYSVSRFASDTNNDENKKLGVLNYLEITNNDFRLEQKIGDFDCMSMHVFIVEFDMQSDLYKSITAGKTFSFFDGTGKEKLTATGVNKQYVICIRAGLGTAGGFNEEDSENMAPFTIGKAQEGYEAFMALESGADESSSQNIITLADTAKQVLTAMGNGYKISDIAHKSREEENKKLGVLNYVLITKEHSALDKKIKDFDTCDVKIYIIEFDTESEEYKSLSVGSQFYFFNGPAAKEKMEVTAINKQFVINVKVGYGSGNRIYTGDYETKPDYSLENVQKGYEAFLELKDSEPKPQGFVQMSHADVMFALVDAMGDYNSFKFADERDVKTNSANSIVEAVDIMQIDGVQKNYTMLDLYLLEYDYDSDALFNLSKGDRIKVSISGITYDLTVAAINKPYVLCATVIYVENNSLIKEETEPLYTYERAKNAYYAFKTYR